MTRNPIKGTRDSDWQELGIEMLSVTVCVLVCVCVCVGGVVPRSSQELTVIFARTGLGKTTE